MDADSTLIGRYEAVFCVFMAVLAYLWRDNPGVVYPHILYLFLVLMSLNLALGVSLRLRDFRPWLSAAFVLANCGVITAILHYSGGPDSNLWVLYLLPIYTACLLLGKRELIWITAGAVLLNAGFLNFELPLWNAESVFTMLVKSAVFLFTAAMTWRIVDHEHRNRQKLRAKKAAFDALEGMMQLQKTQLAESGKMAEIGLLSSGVAHDLNNTFMSVLGFTELALQNEALTPDLQDMLIAVQKAARLGAGMVGHMVGMAKKEKITLAACDLHEVIESVLSVIRPSLRKAAVELRLELNASPAAAEASPTHLQRLFLNLLSNAARSMPEGGVLTIKTEKTEGGLLRVAIEDTGDGIDPEILKKLFTPFSTTMAASGGTGLGLYICSEIAKQHRGELRAENNPDRGSRFVLTLPAAAATLKGCK